MKGQGRFLEGRRFDFGRFTEDEELLVSHSFDEWSRHVVARTAVDVEEQASVESTRPTEVVFQGEPWV